jgi:predicted GNAT family acetyltransferase
VSPSDEAVEVVDNAAESRFEVTVGGRLAGISEYAMGQGVITFTHTEVDDAFEGLGIGSRLAKEALDSARERGLGVRPLCPFIAGYINAHPEYADLVVR